jgi:hypothetical protein
MVPRLTLGRKFVMDVAGLMLSLALLGVTSLRVVSVLSGSLDSAVNATGKKLDPVAGEARKEGGALALSHPQARSMVSRGRWGVFFVVGFNMIVAAAVLGLVFRIARTLRQMVAGLNCGAEPVAAAAGQVSASSQSLPQALSQLAASPEQSSASSSEVNALAHADCGNSRKAAGPVNESQRQFAEANAAMGELRAAMEKIDASSGKIFRIIKISH